MLSFAFDEERVSGSEGGREGRREGLRDSAPAESRAMRVCSLQYHPPIEDNAGQDN